MSRNTIIILFLLLIFGCSDPESFDCVKSKGKIIKKEIQVDVYEKIKIMDEADLVIRNGKERKIVVEAGENLFPKITFDQYRKTLDIYNSNYCNWMRESGNPKIYVNLADLKRLYLYDYSNLTVEDTLFFDDLYIYTDGTGDVNINIKANKLTVYSKYINNFKISGNVDQLKVTFVSDSHFDGSDLITRHAEIIHEGSNIIEVYPVNELKGAITSYGDIYYHHVPEILDVEITGEGKLMKK